MSLTKIVGLFLSISILCSCASTSMVDTWRNPTLQAPPLKKVLVVSLSRKDATRRIFEDVLSSKLALRGVQAVPGYSVVPQYYKTDWTVLQRAVKETGAQAVLTLQTVKIEQSTTVQPGYVTTYPGHWYPEAFPTWDLYGYYGSMANYGPAYISTYDVATMQANLFDATSGKLLWAATLESTEPENVISVGKDLGDLVVKSLVKEGLI
jgi:hypothetical protein